MNERYAILVGLSCVDPARYDGWDGKSGCEGSEVDVDSFHGLLLDEGVPAKNIRVFKSEEATAAAVLTALAAAVRRAQPGDLVMFYYSGHGGQTDDESGDEPEDALDETLCLYDGQVKDDDIGEIWRRLRRSAHGLMISDCCNAATNARATGSPRPFLLRQRRVRSGSGALIQIGAARDGGDAQGWYDGGLFTLALARVAAAGLPNGYAALRDRIQAEMGELAGIPAPQEAQYVEWEEVDPAFAGSRPFSLPAWPTRTGADDDDAHDLPDIFEDDHTNPDAEPAAANLRSGPWAPEDRIAEGQAKLRARERRLGKPLSGGVRAPQKVEGVVLHQTGFARKNVLAAYDGITTHFVVAPDGQTSQLHPIERNLYAANEFNRHTVSIEFVGNFPSAKNNWWPNFPPNQLSRRQVASGRALLAYLKARYPQISHVYGHIQAKGSARGNDPGPDIWRTVGMYALSDLGYQEDLKIHEKYSGLPIPASWRIREPDLVD